MKDQEVIVHDEPANVPKASNLEFYGCTFTRYGGPKLGTRYVAKRKNQIGCGNPVQIFEIDVKRSNAVNGCFVSATENGELLFTIECQSCFAIAEKIAVAAMKALLRERRRRRLARVRAKAKAKAAAEKKEVA